VSDVKGLIERLRGDIFDAVPDDNDMQNVLSVAADALESEHAEVERLTECLEAMNDSADILDSKNARLTAQLQAVREWAQGLIDSDDTSRWGDHCPNTHGRQALAILDATDGATDE